MTRTAIFTFIGLLAITATAHAQTFEPPTITETRATLAWEEERLEWQDVCAIARTINTHTRYGVFAELLKELADVCPEFVYPPQSSHCQGTRNELCNPFQNETPTQYYSRGQSLVCPEGFKVVVDQCSNSLPRRCVYSCQQV